jgi:hypothetical protein
MHIKKKNNNNKKFNDEKTANNNILNIKFVNITNRKSLKYVNLFINKTFNNFLWKNVIYDFDYNDSFIYDLNRFINKITFAYEIIDTLNNFMLIEKYEIMLVINRIHEINRKMFCDNIVYVLFINIILIFITHFKN